MTAPEVPAGWYEDPYGTDADRFHDGSRWTGRTRAPEVDHPPAPSRPRPRWLRLLITAPLVALVLVALVVPSSRLVILMIGILPMAGLIALLAPFASYRRLNAVAAIIFPPWGLWVLVKIVWRLSYRPYRDWVGPADDGPGWERVTHPSVQKPLWFTRSTVDVLQV